ncbi:MAG: C40 family peptidase [Campylobacterales bacterium]|nr:C40 family peptidase [Campylobacterales bacterium]
MLGKKILLSLVLLAMSAQAESQRREPSLFLEYERELKKANEANKDELTPFIKATPPSVSVIKPALPAKPVIKAVASAKAPIVPVLKNTKVETDTIGHDENPFLVTSKPAPVASSSHCPDSDSVDPALKAGTNAMVKNLKNAKDKVLSKAKEFLGTPYGFGSKNGERTDCSGFTQQVFGQFGLSLPRSAAEQARLGENVDLDNLEVGDLLFFRTYKSDPSHVAIYAGNGQIIHASSTAKKVQYDSIDKDYYKQRFLYAKRLSFPENNYVD